MTEYPELSAPSLEPYYSRHVEAMTSEELHSKADIAKQLAWRDLRINGLEHRLGGSEQQCKSIMEDWSNERTRALEADRQLALRVVRLTELEGQVDFWKQQYAAEVESDKARTHNLHELILKLEAELQCAQMTAEGIGVDEHIDRIAKERDEAQRKLVEVIVERTGIGNELGSAIQELNRIADYPDGIQSTNELIEYIELDLDVEYERAELAEKKLGELSDCLDAERIEHEVTKGYRQHAEELADEQRGRAVIAEARAERLRKLLGLTEIPEEPPEYAPDGYGIELDRVVALIVAHDLDSKNTVSQVVDSLIGRAI